MPILLVLLVVTTCLPVPWPAPPPGLGPLGSALLTLAAVLTPVLYAALLSRWVVRTLAVRPQRRGEVLTRYLLARRLIGYANLAAAAGAILGLGWGHTVWTTFRVSLGSYPILVPGGELLVPAPYFLALVLGWAVYFPAERALHRLTVGGQTGEERHEFWSLFGYLLFHLRQFVLLVMFPVGLVTAQQGLARAAPEVVQAGWFHAASVVAVLGLFVLMPRAVKPLLGLKSLPKGAVRDRLEATARRLGFRYTDLLLWPTRGAMANAMVVGVIPWARYVIFTDRLLDGMAPDELDAVFGHEVGHVRHLHIPFYAGFFALSATVATTALGLLEQVLDRHGWTVPDSAAGWLILPPVAVMGAYVFLVFGLLSRRCERQADIFGCRAGSCRDPHCHGHDETTELVPRGRGLCRTGTIALIRALDRVAALNGMDGPAGRGRRSLARRIWSLLQSWQHGPVHDRIEFLLRLSEDPRLGDRHDRRVRWFRLALMAGLVAALVALGSSIGWSEFRAML